MSIKEKIKVYFSDKDNLRLERIKSVRILFMVSSLAFFLSLFFIWASFYDKILLQYLSYTFSLLLLTLYIYLCLIIKDFFKDRIYNLLYFIICFIILVIFSVALFPFIIEGGIKLFVNF